MSGLRMPTAPWRYCLRACVVGAAKPAVGGVPKRMGNERSVVGATAAATAARCAECRHVVAPVVRQRPFAESADGEANSVLHAAPTELLESARRCRSICMWGTLLWRSGCAPIPRRGVRTQLCFVPGKCWKRGNSVYFIASLCLSARSTFRGQEVARPALLCSVREMHTHV